MKTQFTEADIAELIIEGEIPRIIFRKEIFHTQYMTQIIKLTTGGKYDIQKLDQIVSKACISAY